MVSVADPEAIFARASNVEHRSCPILGQTLLPPNSAADEGARQATTRRHDPRERNAPRDARRGRRSLSGCAWLRSRDRDHRRGEDLPVRWIGLIAIGLEHRQLDNVAAARNSQSLLAVFGAIHNGAVPGKREEPKRRARNLARALVIGGGGVSNKQRPKPSVARACDRMRPSRTHIPIRQRLEVV